MKTGSNYIIEQFAKKMDNASELNGAFVHYEYCELYKPDIEGAQGILGSGGACDEVFKDNHAQEELASEGYDLFLEFGIWGSRETLLVRVRDGEGFYLGENPDDEARPVLRLGVLDSDDVKVLVPIYNKLYLDRWAENYMQNAVPSSVAGIHDEFTRVAQNAYNPTIPNKRIRRDFIGVDGLRKIDGIDLVDMNKRLRFSKDADLWEYLVFD